MVVKNYPGGKPVVILGTDGTDLYGVTVDASGHIQVDVLSNVLPADAATQTTLALIKTAVEIIDGFADPLNVLFGYKDRYAEEVSQASGNGDATVTSSTVGAGEVWVVTHLSAWHDDTTARIIWLHIYDGTSQYDLKRVAAIDANVSVNLQGTIVLKENDRIRAYCSALATGKTVYLALNGYKMKI